MPHQPEQPSAISAISAAENTIDGDSHVYNVHSDSESDGEGGEYGGYAAVYTNDDELQPEEVIHQSELI